MLSQCASTQGNQSQQLNASLCTISCNTHHGQLLPQNNLICLRQPCIQEKNFTPCLYRQIHYFAYFFQTLMSCLLILGNLKEALEYAMAHNLWGHALFLSSKMGSRIHEHVMARFTKTNLTSNDPLQTVYELLSDRQPVIFSVSHYLHLVCS